jgi:hypothetical protein
VTEPIGPRAARTLAALRYSQSAEARQLDPLNATLGEIDCLVDLIYTYHFRLEELIDENR